MPDVTLSIAALVGSRICHDLISPVGAIHNGIELIGMGGPIDTPEMQLISDSVENATARIKFFRIAFGTASPQQMLGAAEIARTTAEAFTSGRHKAAWLAEGDVPRAEVQAAFLALLCIESALPRGGDITLERAGDAYVATGRSERINRDPALWEPLAGAAMPDAPRPAHVQFPLLTLALKALDRRIEIAEIPGELTLRF